MGYETKDSLERMEQHEKTVAKAVVCNTPTTDKVWKKDETAALITLYEFEQCLYDNNDPKYFNQEERCKAYQRIHQIMLRIRPECQLSHIKNRIKYLRSHYAAERLRRDVTVKAGIYTEETYKPKFWCFALLQFLDDFVPPIKNSEVEEIKEQMNEKNGDEQNENSASNSKTEKQCNEDASGCLNSNCEINEDIPLDTEEKRKKKRKLDSITDLSEAEQNVMETICLSESSEIEDIFGQYVGCEMKNLRDNPLLYLQTKQAILEVISRANFELIDSK